MRPANPHAQAHFEFLMQGVVGLRVVRMQTPKPPTAAKPASHAHGVVGPQVGMDDPFGV